MFSVRTRVWLGIEGVLGLAFAVVVSAAFLSQPVVPADSERLQAPGVTGEPVSVQPVEQEADEASPRRPIFDSRLLEISLNPARGRSADQAKVPCL